MFRKILYTFLGMFFVLTLITYYYIPNLFGLIPGGKNEIDKTINNIEFDTTNFNNYQFIYSNNNNDSYLLKLRKTFKLDTLIKNANSDLDKVISINKWVQSRWDHDGSNRPKKNDAFYILTEAKKGSKFRCVEYGIVAKACLDAIGIKSRTLSLAAKDVEVTNSGAGHVVTEAYLNDLKKWIFLDPQWDVIVKKDNIPLNAVELQKAIYLKDSLSLVTSNDTLTISYYIDWISPYLFYFTISFDNRTNKKVSIWDGILHRKKFLTLVPLGAKEFHVFQRKFKITMNIYTNSIRDFYSPPNIE